MTHGLADITINIDETLAQGALEQIRDKLVGADGVGSASFHMTKPHLMIVTYDPDKVSAQGLLKTVKGQGVHAELIGL